jgi:hypothetical protein
MFRFIKGPVGRPIPAQRVRVIYAVYPDELQLPGMDGEAGEVTLTKIHPPPENAELYISHFETCPDASRYRRRP